MAFLDELKEKATDAWSIAGKKVEDVYSVAKLKMVIADKESALKKLYRELGEIVYKNMKDGSDDTTEVEDKIAEIDMAAEVLEELREQDRVSRNLTVCPVCNENVSKDAKFCPECGNQMNNAE